MKFNIDRQTIEELNILGKFREGSLYHLFNRVKSRGGEQLLDHMFHHPLTNADDINERSAVFKYFSNLNIPFPFESKQIAQTLEFIDSKNGGHQTAVWLNLSFLKLNNLLTRDERYRQQI